MRLWTLHPRYLDGPGLVAAWREGLLARAVLAGRTRGYRRHPQLERFRAASAPIAAINAYLATIFREAQVRGYRFDGRKLGRSGRWARLPATRGQLLHEWAHLLAKLRRRAPLRFRALRRIRAPEANPMFVVRAGPVAPWEKSPPARTASRLAHTI